MSDNRTTELRSKGSGLMESENQTNVITLLPCPFCGGEAKVFQHGDVGYVVQCRRCGIWNAGYHAAWSHITEDEFNGFIDEESAIEAWNTRSCDQCGGGAVQMTDEAMAAHGWVRERTHMKLPVDADGVPIRPGDTLYEGEQEIPGSNVYAVSHERVYIWNRGGCRCITGVFPNIFTHAKPDTLESLLAGMVKDIASEHVIYVPDDKKDEFGVRLRDIRDDYAERIRKAMEQ